jgi:hypothetical protein
MALSRLVAIPRATIRSDEDALVPGFFVEQHTNDRCIVFVPSVPTPMAGALYIIATSRVHRLNLPAINGSMSCSASQNGAPVVTHSLLPSTQRTARQPRQQYRKRHITITTGPGLPARTSDRAVRQHDEEDRRRRGGNSCWLIRYSSRVM